MIQAQIEAATVATMLCAGDPLPSGRYLTDQTIELHPDDCPGHEGSTNHQGRRREGKAMTEQHPLRRRINDSAWFNLLTSLATLLLLVHFVACRF